MRTSKEATGPAGQASPGILDVNEVVLTGRLSVPPEVRVLPSGRELTTFRLVVRRPETVAEYARPGARKQPVDVIECAVWNRGLARRLAGCSPGDTLVVRGALRRRFTRGDRGLTSWVNVEVADLERSARASTDVAASQTTVGQP